MLAKRIFQPIFPEQDAGLYRLNYRNDNYNIFFITLLFLKNLNRIQIYVLF